MRVVRFEALPAVSWKNGGGTTVEIAVHPPSASMDLFDWRISAAGISEKGPFSRFEGIDRALAILDGDGLRLDFGDHASHVGPGDDPIVFRGESPLTAELLNGPVRDLNVMTRRSAWRAEVSRCVLAPGETASSGGETRILVALDPCAIRCGVELQTLDRLDALVLEGADRATLDQAVSARIIAIAFYRTKQDIADA